MKILFHSFQLGERGTEVMLLNYAKHVRDILGHEPVIVSTHTRPTPGLSLFKDFEVVLYPEIFDSQLRNEHLQERLERIVDQTKADAIFQAKGGEIDNTTPRNCKSWIHGIFRMDEPHGDVYSAVSKYIVDKHQAKHPHVFPIIEHPGIVGNLREELRIPQDAFVFGRHGGYDTFTISWAHEAMKRALDKRKDLYFVFLNTAKFIDHPRAKFLPMTTDIDRKFKFINSCDAMIHSRLDGEIFSQAVAEFSICNKPIVTWSGLINWNGQIVNQPGYDTGHLAVLKEDGIYYHGPNDLENILTGITHGFVNAKDWNVYKNKYSADRVMRQFDNVFIKGLNNWEVDFLEDVEKK